MALIDERRASIQNHPAIGRPMNPITPTVPRASRNASTSTRGQVLREVALHGVQQRRVVEEETEGREAEQGQGERREERVVGHRGGEPPTVGLVVTHHGTGQVVQPAMAVAGPHPGRHGTLRKIRGRHAQSSTRPPV
jgi:hypothetical protein